MKLNRTVGFAAAFLAVFALANVVLAQSPTYRVSQAYTHKNLSILLIHGKNETSKTNIMTLAEALERKLFRVYETSDVNELMVENLSSRHQCLANNQPAASFVGGEGSRVLVRSYFGAGTGTRLVVPPAAMDTSGIRLTTRYSRLSFPMPSCEASPENAMESTGRFEFGSRSMASKIEDGGGGTTAGRTGRETTPKSCRTR